MISEQAIQEFFEMQTKWQEAGLSLGTRVNDKGIVTVYDKVSGGTKYQMLPDMWNRVKDRFIGVK